MTILDIGRLLDVERFRKINTDAGGPAEVHPDPAALAADLNTGFLLQCARTIRRIDVADHASGRIYARIEAGAVQGIDPDALAPALDDPDTRAGLLALAPGIRSARAWSEPRWLGAEERTHTVGAWGEAGSA